MSLLLHAANGNIVIIASNGKIRMEADDIEMVARGSGGKSGNVKITASENVHVEAKKIALNGKNLVRIVSPSKVRGSCQQLFKVVWIYDSWCYRCMWYKRFKSRWTKNSSKNVLEVRSKCNLMT